MVRQMVLTQCCQIGVGAGHREQVHSHLLGGALQRQLLVEVSGRTQVGTRLTCG